VWLSNARVIYCLRLSFLLSLLPACLLAFYFTLLHTHLQIFILNFFSHLLSIHEKKNIEKSHLMLGHQQRIYLITKAVINWIFNQRLYLAGEKSHVRKLL